MAQHHLLYFTATDQSVYRFSSGRLEFQARFEANETGLATFREYLGTRKGALFYLVADLAGEDFHEDQIPYLRGGDRQAIIDRRIAQRYRDTRLAAALSLGTLTGERRNERLLLASFTNTQQFAPWMDALAEAGARLAGVFSVPLVAPQLAARLGTKSGRCILVSANRAGLRQSYVDSGRLRFSRLEGTPEMESGMMAAFVRSETQRLAQYLGTLRALPRDGSPVQVIVVAPPGQKQAFEQTLVSDARLVFHTIDSQQAARAAGLKAWPEGTLAEALYLCLAAKRPPKEQFAQKEDTRGFFIWRLQRGIAFAGVATFAACAVYAGAKWLDISSVREQTEIQRTEARNASSEYERITAAFPVTQTTTDNLRATVLEFTRIAQRNRSPEPAFGYVSQVLERFPQIELEALAWRVPKMTPAETAPGAAPAAAPAASPSGNAPLGASEVLEVSGRVNVAQRSDYREITAQVQRFADALGEKGLYQVQRVQLPFDVSSEGTLTGDIGANAASGEAPRFTVTLARGFK
jgi:hypothetical protein